MPKLLSWSVNFKTTTIDGALEIVPKIFSDNRGWFLELHKEAFFSTICPSVKFVQENLSFSKKGVIRGLHMQLPTAQQAKLVTVVKGKVLDVIVDLRAGSPDFGKIFTLILDGDQHNMLFIPEGCAHGFAALEDSIFMYRCSGKYSPKHEIGVCWNDPQLKIEWGIKSPILSKKDEKLPTLKELILQSIISPK